MSNKYSTQKSVQDLFRHVDKLGLNKNSIKDLKKAEKFYHNFSHISVLTIASWTSFSKQSLYVGGSFDQGKIESYRKEINGRLSLAEVFSNFIEGVKTNFVKGTAKQDRQLEMISPVSEKPFG